MWCWRWSLVRGNGLLGVQPRRVVLSLPPPSLIPLSASPKEMLRDGLRNLTFQCQMPPRSGQWRGDLIKEATREDITPLDVVNAQHLVLTQCLCYQSKLKFNFAYYHFVNCSLNPRVKKTPFHPSSTGMPVKGLGNMIISLAINQPHYPLLKSCSNSRTEERFIPKR